MSIPAKPLVSLVVPVLNEEGNIGLFHQTVLTEIQPLAGRYDFEFVFTDNHSDDRTFDLLLALAGQDARVRVFRFTKNVGFQKSILTGYLNARGDAVIQLDCDLQDPPSLIRRFIELWEQGYHVVYGIRRSRKEGWLITQVRDVFYYVIDKLSEYPLPRQAGDFRLVARPVIEVLRRMDDAFPYLRGIIPGLGFNQTGIPYDRDERRQGASKFSLSSLMALAIDGIVATSIVPLRLAVFLGMVVSFLSLAALVSYLAGALLFRSHWPSGFATMAVLLSLNLGLNSLFLGIVGEYLGRLYVQSKKRPVSIIEYSVEGGLLRNHAPCAYIRDDQRCPPSYGGAESCVPKGDHEPT